MSLISKVNNSSLHWVASDGQQWTWVWGTEAVLLIPPSWTFLHFANTCGAPSFTQKMNANMVNIEYVLSGQISVYTEYWNILWQPLLSTAKTLLQYVQDSQINKNQITVKQKKMRDIACKKISLQYMLVTAQNHINKKHVQYIIDPALHLNQSRGHLDWCKGLPALLGGNLGCRIV